MGALPFNAAHWWWMRRGRGPGAAPGPISRGRRLRLTLLIAAIVVMSVVDLVCTLTYMRMVGMIELNPLARAMISIGQTRQLVMFKAFTVTFACGTIFLLRRHGRAELAAWAAAGALACLMLHWFHYNSIISTITNDVTVLALGDGSTKDAGGWVRLSQ